LITSAPIRRRRSRGPRCVIAGPQSGARGCQPVPPMGTPMGSPQSGARGWSGRSGRPEVLAPLAARCQRKAERRRAGGPTARRRNGASRAGQPTCAAAPAVPRPAQYSPPRAQRPRPSHALPRRRPMCYGWAMPMPSLARTSRYSSSRTSSIRWPARSGPPAMRIAVATSPQTSRPARSAARRHMAV
jgi:hypothetical protein